MVGFRSGGNERGREEWMGEEEANGNKREGNTVDVLSVLSVLSVGEKMRVELDVCRGRIWYDCIT